VAIFAVATVMRPHRSAEYTILGTLFAFFPLAIRLTLETVTRLTPYTIDGRLSAFDDGLSVVIYHFVSHHSVLHGVLCLPYYGLPIFAALILVTAPQRILCGKLLLLASFLAPVFYYLAPAVGPAWVDVSSAPRNCFPSLHMTWALVFLIYASPRLRTAAVVFAALTMAATVGLGEHYIVDLVAAVPYTLLTNYIVCRTAQEKVPEMASAPASVGPTSGQTLSVEE
jgi:hypothetical protein